MTNDKDLKQLFEAHRTEFSDKGFSEEIKHRLPERPSYLPQFLMLISIIAGLTLTVSILGVTTISANIVNFVSAIGHLQLPSAISTITYMGMFATLCLIGFAMSATDTE
ncbi:hypothetical protein FACS1894162_2640 [Bacteroidia bacterium]|nr:hypothetical protein FACS1894162_2640 [Bacteroidia bacterium]